MALGKCYRCKTVVEPYLSPQWFVKTGPLAIPAIEAVETGNIRIIPDGWKNNYLGWMRNIKDWCISRQIWWGHQIPAWYCRSCNKDHLLEPNVAAEGTAEESPKPIGLPFNELFHFFSKAKPIVSQTDPTSCPDCGGTDLFQDPDVLDTWFSPRPCGRFPHLGWPDQTQDFKTFYPNAHVGHWPGYPLFLGRPHGHDGHQANRRNPFPRCLYPCLGARCRGDRKMSKSKGNVIDPLTKMSQYGTDALRFTMASMASPGRDMKLAEERIEGYRNFATKIWNAARFIQLHTDGTTTSSVPESRPFPDQWILSRLNHAIHEKSPRP